MGNDNPEKYLKLGKLDFEGLNTHLSKKLVWIIKYSLCCHALSHDTIMIIYLHKSVKM